MHGINPEDSRNSDQLLQEEMITPHFALDYPPSFLTFAIGTRTETETRASRKSHCDAPSSCCAPAQAEPPLHASLIWSIAGVRWYHVAPAQFNEQARDQEPAEYSVPPLSPPATAASVCSRAAER